ncbi:type II toxin-antitoxin system VapB family antitoxin [Cronobacter sakazakii]|uniref:type II toxin-antitoxin system VapB family antitoxin n=1 Tax=Enterobacter cloacae complex TaxID=354276 RepID=UPI00044C24F8|nr:MULTISPECIES: type II toxin-antitoxin system VapB family antitoxin [Enterobacter cloacae complex]KAB1466693.1 AbrB/MazE/SpoVT family DNA-binding domain-containing protein [Cronobacter sakazakii]HAT4519816.1 AbrB/MazE/SpoVT family DNA-binding domain-containing protein [Serratia marcescens]HCN0848001.1 AbrB/MazE/SpoVT family DNA-binding domain-containing protein [Escherichia coli]EUM20223.1 hypothetical protein L462_04763 [Enterobacter sp. BIDMC 26]MCK7033324.1 type II toxin-antitoxin system 
MKKIVSIFTNGNNRAIRIPREMDFEGVSELEIQREGDTLILKPVRPTWSSLKEEAKADPDFLQDRPNVIDDTPQ